MSNTERIPFDSVMAMFHAEPAFQSDVIASKREPIWEGDGGRLASIAQIRGLFRPVFTPCYHQAYWWWPRPQSSSVAKARDGCQLNTSASPALHHYQNVPEDRNEHKGFPDESTTAFSGETSLAHNITVVEGRLEQMGVRYSRLRSEPPNNPFSSRLTPSPRASVNENHRQKTLSYIHQVLDSNGIIPNRSQWDRAMHTFCDEVHILVPFLHLPSVWEAYESMWASLSVPNASHHFRRSEWRFTFAWVLLCLANGTCVESSRVDNQDRQYSAGWSLYRAARDIFGDLLDVFSQCTDQILLLQNIVLMVRPSIDLLVALLIDWHGILTYRLYIFFD